MAPLKPIKWYRDLATKKGRRYAGAFLVEGERAVGQVIGSSPDAIIELLVVEGLSSPGNDYPLRRIRERQMHSICSTRTPQGIAAVIRVPADTYSDRLPADIGAKILLLEDIQDPGNVGALIRTAAAFAFSGIILTEKCADHLSPKCVQSTAGTVLSLWIRRTSRYLEVAGSIKKEGYRLVAADLGGVEDTSSLQNNGRLLLALGNEAAGLSSAIIDIADYRVRIPIVRQKAESLNVAACGAICMYLSCQQD